MKRIVTGIISLYQKTLSPNHSWLASYRPYSSCRYYPTCSEYTKQSVIRHGVARGLLLGAARILRCHPWAASGHDPILETREN